jgi:hypothetical protein
LTQAAVAKAFGRSGFRLLMVGATLSLGCNFYAGSNIGERAFGVLVVGAFMLLEHHATKAGRASVVPVTDEVDEALKAKRSEAARKAAETRKRNAAQQRTRKPRARRQATTVAALEQAYSLPRAPVSPAS